MLVLIFLSSFLLYSCGGYPPVNIHVFDTRFNVSNPHPVEKYNKETCEIEFKKPLPDPIPLCGLDAQGRPVMNPYYNGGVYISSGDYTKVKAKAKADCKNAQDNK